LTRLTRSRRLAAGTVLAAGTASSLLILAGGVPASGATGPAPAKVAVPQDMTASGLNSTPVFPTPYKTRETVSFVLKVRKLSQLEAVVDGGMRGGFLSARKFAAVYGQPKSNISALEGFLADYGIKSKSYGDGLEVSATGTAGEFDNALSVSQHEYRIKAVPARDGQAGRPATTIHGTTDKPLLPRKLAAFVSLIAGLTNYPTNSSNAVHANLPKGEPRGVHIGNRTPEDFARQYNLKPLQAKGAEGQGQTIGIITYASLRPADATHFWSKTLGITTKPGRITLDNIDGGSGPVSNDAGSGETTLDVEQSGALAPQANIIVYQAPNTDSGTADALFDVASQDKASVVSTSWGESEIYIQAAAAAGQEPVNLDAIFDEAYLEMAAQGQSSFNAAGDDGAYDDTEDYPQVYTELSVDNPASSPWATTGGGTTEPGRIPLYNSAGNLAVTVYLKAQRAWGWDWQYKYYSLFDNANGDPYTSEAQFAADPYNTVGGGGGYSVTEPRPAYQKLIPGTGSYTAVPYLTPATEELYPGTKDFYLPTTFAAWAGASASPATPPALVTGHASGRVVPDLSADADPYTGYEEYYIDFPRDEGHLEYGWGGTSFVAPQLAGAAAVIDSYLGGRAGFWNTAIYRFAAGQGSPFTPLDAAGTSNDNLYYTGTPGSLFNPASGLGVPNLAKLAADFRAHRQG
jgi:kumamolisin